MKWIQDGASIALGFNTQGDIGIAAQAPGSGYTNAGTCQVVGGTFAIQATCKTALTASGGIVAVITNPGSGYTVAPTAINAVGKAGGSGFSTTPLLYPNPYTDPYDQQLLSLSVLSGRVDSFTNLAVSGTTVVDAQQRYISNGVAGQCANPAGAYTRVVYSLGGDVLLNAINGETSPNTEPPKSGEQVFAEWAALTSQAVKDGCLVVAYTPSPKDGDVGTGQTSSGYEIARQKAAALMRSQGVQCTPANRSTYCNYDVGIDIGGMMQNTHDTDVFNGQDRTHLNHGGERQWAAIANRSLMLQSAFTYGLAAPLGTTYPYLSVTGKGTELLNSFSLAFNGGTSYLDSLGGLFGQYGNFIFRAQDGAGNIVNVLVVQGSSGNTNVAGGLYALGGPLGAQGNYAALLPGSTNIQYNPGSGGYLDVEGAGSTAPAVTIRGLNSSGTPTVYATFAAGTGAVSFPSVKSGNGYTGLINSVGQFCFGILVSPTTSTCQ